jgi:hypothetical protein
LQISIYRNTKQLRINRDKRDKGDIYNPDLSLLSSLSRLTLVFLFIEMRFKLTVFIRLALSLDIVLYHLFVAVQTDRADEIIVIPELLPHKYCLTSKQALNEEIYAVVSDK